MRRWVPSLAVLGYLATAALGNEIELVCVLYGEPKAYLMNLETRRCASPTMFRHVRQEVLGGTRRPLHIS